MLTLRTKTAYFALFLSMVIVGSLVGQTGCLEDCYMMKCMNYGSHPGYAEPCFGIDGSKKTCKEGTPRVWGQWLQADGGTCEPHSTEKVDTYSCGECAPDCQLQDPSTAADASCQVGTFNCTFIGKFPRKVCTME